MAKNGSNRANVVFMPSGKRGSVEKGTTILKAAQELAVDLNSICGGRGRCSKCQVEPIFGEFSKLNLISKEMVTHGVLSLALCAAVPDPASMIEQI